MLLPQNRKGGMRMNIFIVGQSFKQLWGLIVLGRKYKGKYPEAGHYRGTVKYSLPFRGQWVAVNGGVTPEVSHSWQIPTQRYAYDFVILDSTGKSCRSGDTEPSAFYCYGQDILAPADGTVMETGTGRPDSKITADRKASCAARDIRGNYILIQHAAGESFWRT